MFTSALQADERKLHEIPNVTIYICNMYLHTYIYGAVNTDTHGWGGALALGCPGTTTRFRDLSDTGQSSAAFSCRRHV